MLFGASMLLVIERAEAAGERGWSGSLAANGGPARVRPGPLLLDLVRRHSDALRHHRHDRPFSFRNARSQFLSVRRRGAVRLECGRQHRQRGRSPLPRPSSRTSLMQRPSSASRGKKRRTVGLLRHDRQDRATSKSSITTQPFLDTCRGHRSAGATLLRGDSGRCPRRWRPDAARHGAIQNRFSDRRLGRSTPIAASHRGALVPAAPRAWLFGIIDMGSGFYAPLITAAVHRCSRAIPAGHGHRLCRADHPAVPRSRAARAPHRGRRPLPLSPIISAAAFSPPSSSTAAGWRSMDRSIALARDFVRAALLGDHASLVEAMARPLPLRSIRMGMAQPRSWEAPADEESRSAKPRAAEA